MWKRGGVKNNIWYPGVEVWNSFATSFMMPLMFVISGASLFFSIGKGGFGKFLKDKVLRLLVPLLVVDLTHASLQAYLENIWHERFTGNLFQFLPHYHNLASINWLGVRMWYMLFLFVFSIILYPLLRWFAGSGQGFLSKLDVMLAKSGVLYILTFPFLLL
jgi:glucans biosynthesis protein C